MMWLLLRGDLPTKEQAWLLEATLVASVDHGSVALSASTARMAVTRGLPVNGALASAINVLDDVHGGPAEQCMELYLEIAREAGDDVEPVRAVGVVLQHWRERGGKFLPGFGHRFHPLDPRTPKILKQVDSIAGSGAISGRFACIGRTVERALSLGKAKPIPMRAGLRAGARAQPVHSEPRPGLAGARLGVAAARRTHQGPDTAGDPISVHGTRTPRPARAIDSEGRKRIGQRSR